MIIQSVLSLKNLHRFFPVVVSSSDVKRGKPAPDIFLRAAELLKVDPKDCVVIEDSKPGVTAGLAAGMKVIAITATHPAVELRAATRIVRSYEEIEHLLLHMYCRLSLAFTLRSLGHITQAGDSSSFARIRRSFFRRQYCAMVFVEPGSVPLRRLPRVASWRNVRNEDAGH